MDTYGVVLQWGPHRGPHGPMGPHGGAGSGMAQWGGAGGVGVALWPLLLLLLGLLLLAGVVAAVYLLRRSVSTADSDQAMDLLRERYARGEVTDEEFETRAERLTGSADTDPSTTS